MGVARPKEGSLLSIQEGSGFESRAMSSRREEAMGIPEQVRLTKKHVSKVDRGPRTGGIYNTSLLQVP